MFLNLGAWGREWGEGVGGGGVVPELVTMGWDNFERLFFWTAAGKKKCLLKTKQANKTKGRKVILSSRPALYLDKSIMESCKTCWQMLLKSLKRRASSLHLSIVNSSQESGNLLLWMYV